MTAISTSRAKEEEAKGFGIIVFYGLSFQIINGVHLLGAHHFLALKEEAELKKFEDYFDFIIITSPSEIEFKVLLSSILHLFI